MAGWLPEDVWRQVQAAVPIACVDVLPLQVDGDGRPTHVGLIQRYAPSEPARWCLVGGRLHHDEPFAGAIARQIAETFGPAVTFEVPPDVQPAQVIQYSPMPGREGFFHDPRQHAVSLIYAVALAGDLRPQGEALDFAWFALDALPDDADIGFGQAPAIRRCIAQVLAA